MNLAVDLWRGKDKLSWLKKRLGLHYTIIHKNNRITTHYSQVE